MGRWVMEWEGASGKGDGRHGQSRAVADFGAGPGWSIWRGGWRNPESSRGLAPCYLTIPQGCCEAGTTGVCPACIARKRRCTELRFTAITELLFLFGTTDHITSEFSLLRIIPVLRKSPSPGLACGEGGRSQSGWRVARFSCLPQVAAA